MIKYLVKIIKDFPEKIVKTATTGGGANLYKIRDPDDPNLPHDFYLPEEQAVAFHHTLAQLLFASQRARRDLQPYVSFLSKRVKKPDRDDWGKMKRLLQYIKGTLHMKLTLEIDDTGEIHWLIDSSHQCHKDCKGQTGAGMTMGKGAILSGSLG